MEASILISFISVPPRVKPRPADGNIVVKKGTEVSLECDASGNPVPKITWTREVRTRATYRVLNCLLLSLAQRKTTCQFLVATLYLTQYKSRPSLDAAGGTGENTQRRRKR